MNNTDKIILLGLKMPSLNFFGTFKFQKEITIYSVYLYEEIPLILILLDPHKK